ncbi:MAG: excinuclease ABC subunit UvrB [Anaerolineaceae bacterium]|nr:excinuclease ABC subunit UvrB [Anaerolineaceae bacterium]
MQQFKLVSEYEPRGDQPRAIKQIVAGLGEGRPCQTLLGVTGSGKTFTMANVIEQVQRPTLVISHNKTLAAQLYSEFKEFFPGSAVAYFVSYYDYYQPEAYIPARDIYIEKDASINEDIDRLRLRATSALMSRNDVIVVASVSCIFGLGAPEDYQKMVVSARVGQRIERDDLLRRLVDIQYERNDIDFGRGKFRVRGDTVELYPAYEEFAYRLEFFGDQIELIEIVNPISGAVAGQEKEIYIYPAKHFVMPEDRVERALEGIAEELEQRLAELRGQGKLLEAQRLEARTRHDMEMMREVGYCSGIENYSRHLSARAPGERPFTLIDYFPENMLCLVDESHVTVPQIGAMFEGDQSRKRTLVEHGFRLPSALDNRPLKFKEWESIVGQTIYISATPGPYELKRCGGEVVEQVIRPTGLVDPQIRIEPARTQVEQLMGEVRRRVAMGDRTLVTTLTKRLAEDLSGYLNREGIRCKYLHSEIETFDRVEILRDLRKGEFDALVGVNLLREGLDLPEVSLVAILDADREGFLRSTTSLLQTIGRSARNVNAEVILYADLVTDSMRRAIDETNRRREKQVAYNTEHNIKPDTIRKAIRVGIEAEVSARRAARIMVHESESDFVAREYLAELEKEMHKAAANLEFERAAALRDRILAIKEAASGQEQQKDAGLAGPAGRRTRR